MPSFETVTVVGQNHNVTVTDKDGKRVVKSSADDAFEVSSDEFAELGPDGLGALQRFTPAAKAFEPRPVYAPAPKKVSDVPAESSDDLLT